MSNTLGNGTAAITGAASGQGRATAIAFARDGCKALALGDIAMPGLEETREMVRKSCPDVAVEISHLDVSDEVSVISFYDNAVAKFGRIDFAANVAGYGGKAKPSTEESEADYDKYFGVNQRGVFLCERALLRIMPSQQPLPGFESRGSIVNITSLCATLAINNRAAYSASKAGAHGLGKVDAWDYGPEGIRVNSIAPGNVVTPMLENAMGAAHMEHFAQATPLRRLGKPEDIANAIVWLSSNRAQYLTGITLPVDGGLSLTTGPP